MTQPTHTHKENGGRFAMVAHYNGDTALDAQMIVVYRDLDREIETATTAKDWEHNWKPIAADDCTLCLGSGRDAIKGAKHQPCGGCYGLGKVMKNGARPEDCWQVADVALAIIRRQQTALQRLHTLESTPEVMQLVKRLQDQAIGGQEQKWRGSRGKGPNGQRVTGD